MSERALISSRRQAAPLPCRDERVDASIAHYENARAFANRERERQRLALRLEQTKKTAPDCARRLADARVGEVD